MFARATRNHGTVTHATFHHVDYGLPPGVQGAADRHFACAMRAFANLFPGRRFGGGALAVYLDGRPVVDVWTGYSDRRGEQHWTADTGAMVFSATKGMASTVIHRLVNRGLLAYDVPVAEFWPEFGANGKGRITIRDVMRHRAGLSHLNGVTRDELMNHRLMEERLAAAPAGRFRGIPAYHALTYGWLMSGLARAVTGMGMRDLIRSELAQSLNTDGLHLGRPPAEAPTHVAQILTPQSTRVNQVFNFIAPKIAAPWFSGGFGAMYFPGMKAVVQGEIPFLDGELPSVNGVATARGLAKMYAAIANSGRIDGQRFLSAELVRDLTGKPSCLPDYNIVAPLSWHMGYHAVPGPGLPGFGHAGLGGSVGWADPSTGMSFAFVHNRLLSPFLLLDHTGLATLGSLIRRGVALARKHGFRPVTEFGASFGEPGAVAG